MAIVPADSGRYTALRVVAVALGLAVPLAIVSSAFYIADAIGVLSFTDAVMAVRREINPSTLVILLVPAPLIVLATMIFSARILWRASGPAGGRRNNVEHRNQV